MRWRGALLVGLLLLVGAAGCGTTSSPASTSPAVTPTGTTAKACDALNTIGSGLDSLSKVGTNTTVAEAQAKQQQIASSLDKLSSLTSNIAALSGDTLNKLKAANDELGSMLEGQPPNNTIGQSSVKIQDFQAKVILAQAAHKLLSGVLKCPATPTATP